jgi:hypothetical protein
MCLDLGYLGADLFGFVLWGGGICVYVHFIIYYGYIINYLSNDLLSI